MRFGVLLGDMPRAVPPRAHLDNVLRQVEAAQRNGFDHLVLGQHFLYGDVRWLQPIPTLARLAAEVDGDTRLCAVVLIAPLYHPVQLAEDLATLDIVSDGRLVVGIGAGYRREEFRQLGVPFEDRFARMAESVELLTKLWALDEVTFDGKFWSLHAATPHLRPVQQPRPELWIGARSLAGMRRSARLGDAAPIGPSMDLHGVVTNVEVYLSERRALGRPLGLQPLRREIVLGTDRETALRRYLELTSERHGQYNAREAELFEPAADPSVVATRRAIFGSPEECRKQLVGLVNSVPVDPIIVRVAWPGATTEDAVAMLDELGTEIVKPLRGVTGVDPAAFLDRVEERPRARPS